MDRMREEFEAWCCKRGYTLKPAETNCGIIIEGAYGHPTVQIAWQAWKASRAAMVVELPAEDIIFGNMAPMADFIGCLEDAGVSYK